MKKTIKKVQMKTKYCWKMLSFFLIIVLSIFILAPGSKTHDGVFFDLKPRELRIIEVTDQGQLIDTMQENSTLTPLIKKAINSIPYWIKPDLIQQFKDLKNRPILPYTGSTPATGDLNNDSTLDLVIGSSKGFFRFFINKGIQQKTALQFVAQMNFPYWKDCEINPALFDLNADGFADLILGVKNQLFIMFNKKEKTNIAFSDPTLWFTDESAKSINGENLTPCPVDIDSTLAIILGHKDGRLSLLKKENGVWKDNPDYFKDWKGSSNITPTVFSTNQNGYILIIGNKEGTFDSFALQLGLNKPQVMKPLHLLDKIRTKGDSSPAFYDVDNNGRIDVIFCSNEEPCSFLINEGTNASIEFQILDSGAEKNITNSIFGGTSYYRDYDSLYASNFNNQLSETIANFLLNVDHKYRDEVAYCIANLQVSDVVSYVKFEKLYLLEENAKEIYDMCQQVSYVKIKELRDATTLSYNSESGWKDMPTDVYYKYLVMLNRFLLVPNHFESTYHNNFFRSFLPNDKTYGITLFDRVKGAKTLYEAAYQVMYWLKEDIGGVWRTGKKPAGWFYIYKNLTSKDVGLWCGEWSVIYEACARAMNIPTVSIVSLGEDHQFNNFWADGWHHLDASAGESKEKGTWKPFFDNSLIYYTQWGNRVLSWPMENEENGKYNHVWRSDLPYNPEEMLSNLTFIVKDVEGTPIDGARIELWSHWQMEAKKKEKPFITAFGYTNSDGKATIRQVGTQNFTVIVVSRIGSKEFPLSLKTPGDQILTVQIPSKIPSLYSFNSLKKQIIVPPANSINRSFQIRLSKFTQQNLPIAEIYTTALQYVNFWKQDNGYAELYFLSQTELSKLKAGFPLDYGEYKKIDGFNLVNFHMPDLKTPHEKYYLVFWNPNFSTQMRVKVE